MRFDRVVSVEMMEHVCNNQASFERIASWLEPEGSLFVHVFVSLPGGVTGETPGQAPPRPV